jgi:hypothetical protein
MYNKKTNAHFQILISPFYCFYIFRYLHNIIRKLFCSLLNYTKIVMQFLWCTMKKLFVQCL